MATHNHNGGGGTSLLAGIRGSAATERLMQSGRQLIENKLDGLGGSLGGLTDRLGEVAEGGALPLIGKTAKNMGEGKGAGRSVIGAVGSGLTDKAKGLLGKGHDGENGGDTKADKKAAKAVTKAMNIEESIDVGVPVSVAYNQWTQFEDFSQFTKGVESVEQKDDTELVWRAKVFKSHRNWNAKIVEQVPDKRIVWTSDGPKGTTRGVVTFHPLGDELTRVLLAIEYYPQGAFERIGNIWRAAGRRARLDLKNYRRFVMLENKPTGEWRGEIHDGKVANRSAKKSAPAKQSGRQPAKAAASQQAKATKRQPAKAAERQPAKANSRQQPAKATKRQPAKASKRQPAKAAKRQPAKAAKRPAARTQPAKSSRSSSRRSS